MSFTDRRAFLKSSVTLAAALPLARLSLDAAETPATPPAASSRSTVVVSSMTVGRAG